MLQITLGAAILPSALLMWYFHSRDTYPEPPRVIWATFGLGVLTVIPVLIVAIPMMIIAKGIPNIHGAALATAFLGAAIPEEFFKFTVLRFYCARHKEFNEPMDGIVYGVAGSLGFATLENVLYVAQGGLQVAIMRALTAVPGHAFLGAIMGYFVGRAWFEPQRRGPLLCAALAVPILLHGLYDYPIMALQSQLLAWGGEVPSGGETLVLGLVLLTLAVFIVETVWAILAARRLRKLQGPTRRMRPTAIRHKTEGSRAGGIFLVSLGALLACGGGFFLLAALLALFLEESQNILPQIGCVSVLFGFLPLGLGIFLFARGIRSLNRAPV